MIDCWSVSVLTLTRCCWGWGSMTSATSSLSPTHSRYASGVTCQNFVYTLLDFLQQLLRGFQRLKFGGFIVFSSPASTFSRIITGFKIGHSCINPILNCTSAKITSRFAALLHFYYFLINLLICFPPAAGPQGGHRGDPHQVWPAHLWVWPGAAALPRAGQLPAQHHPRLPTTLGQEICGRRGLGHWLGPALWRSAQQSVFKVAVSRDFFSSWIDRHLGPW